MWLVSSFFFLFSFWLNSLFPSLIYIVVCINTSLKNIFIHCICIIVLFAHHVYVLCSQKRKALEPQNWSCGWLLVVMWVREPNAGSLLSHLSSSSASFFLWPNNIFLYNVVLVWLAGGVPTYLSKSTWREIWFWLMVLAVLVHGRAGRRLRLCLKIAVVLCTYSHSQVCIS